MQRLLEGLRAVNVAGKAAARQTREELHAKRGTAADVAATSAVHPVVRTIPRSGARRSTSTSPIRSASRA